MLEGKRRDVVKPLCPRRSRAATFALVGGPDQSPVRDGNFLNRAQHACPDSGVHRHAQV